MFKDYLREFLRPSHRQAPSLGDATRPSMLTSKVKVDAALFLYHLLGYSPNSRLLEQELLVELCKISTPANTIVNELSQVRETWPDEVDWAYRLFTCLPPAGNDKTSVMPSLRKLAEGYFNHLGLALWNLPGKSTPDVSIRPTPNHDLIKTVTILLREAKEGRKSSLKRAVEIRDVPVCPVTKLLLEESAKPGLGIQEQVGVSSELAHIIPFSLHSKTHAHVALETFTGATITAGDLAHFINSPENAMLLEHNAHREYAKRFAWGVEAVTTDDDLVHFYVRAVRPDRLSQLTKPGMNNEIMFGTRRLTTELGPLVPNPDPRFCNLILAVMRVLHASGAAEVLDQLREDDEQSRGDGSNMGMSQRFDDLFMTKLSYLEMSCPVLVN